MPSPSSRARTAARRSPRPAASTRARPAPPVERPLEAPFAAVFGVLVAAEYGYLSWLLHTGSFWDWYVVVPALLAVLAVAGAVLVVLGRGRGWLLLTVAAVVLAVGLFAMVLLFGALGGGAALWQALLLLAGPIGCLALTLRRPVREWSGRARTRRSTGGRRNGDRAR